MNDTAVLTVVFPPLEKYLPDFLDSLAKQTFTEYDLIIVNDGILNLENIIHRYKFSKVWFISGENNPAKNRELGINFARQKDIKYLIFADADDFSSENRISESRKVLAKSDICVHEISVVNNSGKILCENYFSNRIKHGQKITLVDLLDKNLLGLGNTAINLHCLNSPVQFEKSLTAVDWFFYTQLLIDNKQARFTNRAKVYYRQHNENTVGIGDFSEENIKQAVIVKKQHYQKFKNYPEFYKLDKSVNSLAKKINNPEFFKKYYKYCSKKRVNFPCWWENAIIPTNFDLVV